MRPTIRLGRIAGIEVGHPLEPARDRRPARRVARGRRAPRARRRTRTAPTSRPRCSRSCSFFASILAHELAHSIVARRQGQTVDGITLWLLGGVSKLGSEPRDAARRVPRRDRRARDDARARGRLRRAGIPVRLGRRARHAVADRRRVARGRQPHPRRLQPAPGAPLDGGRVLTAMLWKRNGDRRRSQISAGARRTRARSDPRRRIARAGVRRVRLLRHRARRLVRAQRVPSRGELGAPAAHPRRPPGRRAHATRSRTPPPTGPPWPRSGPSPSRRCSSGGTATRPRCCPPARCSPSRPRPASTCNSARSACRSRSLTRVPSRRAGHRRRRPRGCPRSSKTPTATRSACSGSKS